MEHAVIVGQNTMPKIKEILRTCIQTRVVDLNNQIFNSQKLDLHIDIYIYLKHDNCPVRV